MSITKSYNKQTGFYYAYETYYEWDEALQKRVQHKHCIGKFDPETGEVIPNGKPGRPSGVSRIPRIDKEFVPLTPNVDTSGLIARCKKIDSMLSEATSELSDLEREIDEINSASE